MNMPGGCQKATAALLWDGYSKTAKKRNIKADLSVGFPSRILNIIFFFDFFLLLEWRFGFGIQKNKAGAAAMPAGARDGSVREETITRER